MSSLRTTLRNSLRQYMMLLTLLAIILIFQVLTNGVLLKPMNVSNLIFQNAYVVILAVGMLMCILTGGVDLQLAPQVALIGACAGTFIITWGWNSHLSILLCLVIAIGLGIWQGFWIAYMRIPAFIVTLSGMLVFRGLTLIVLNGMTLAPSPGITWPIPPGTFLTFPRLAAVWSAQHHIPLDWGYHCSIYALGQFGGYRARQRKGYSVESLWTS